MMMTNMLLLLKMQPIYLFPAYRKVYRIPTAENGIIFFSDDTPAYITKRFDIRDNGTKIPQEDFASLIEKTSETHGRDFKYTGSYEDIALKIKELVPAWQVEMGKFFSLVLFNYLFANGDAHLKNFSLQLSEDGIEFSSGNILPLWWFGLNY